MTIDSHRSFDKIDSDEAEIIVKYAWWKRRRKKGRIHRRWYVRPLNRARILRDEFHTLMEDMRRFQSLKSLNLKLNLIESDVNSKPEWEGSQFFQE